MEVVELLLWSCGFVIALIACQEQGKKSDGRLKIVASTGIIADAVKNIVGDSAQVIAIMGAGVDPHLYKASQGDIGKLSTADVLIYNGLHLEGKMNEIFKKLSNQKKVIAMADGLAKEELLVVPGSINTPDPHIWFDVDLWNKTINYMTLELCKADPMHSNYYKGNFNKYAAELENLDKKVSNYIQSIPQNQRILITAHDAFGYFGRRYKIKVLGLQGISTVSDFGLNDLSKLSKLIIEKNIKAVFVESSVPKKSMEALVEGCRRNNHSVSVGGLLFSDALGNENTPQGNYIGMVNYNVETIVKALK